MIHFQNLLPLSASPSRVCYWYVLQFVVVVLTVIYTCPSVRHCVWVCERVLETEWRRPTEFSQMQETPPPSDWPDADGHDISRSNPKES